MSAGEAIWLSVDQLHFRRGERVILHNIGLQFRPGELTLLTGHNGSGKTTLFRILAGLEKPQAARLGIAGQEYSWSRCYRQLRSQICYLHQHPYLFDCSVFDNIAYGLKRKGLRHGEVQKKVAEALELIGLTHLAQRHSSELSGGEKQRAAIARAWVLAPRLMLLDEPVANLDKRARQQCYELIQQLQAQQIGVVFTSHDPVSGRLQLDRHIHLYDGRLSDKTVQTSAAEVVPLARPSAG